MIAQNTRIAVLVAAAGATVASAQPTMVSGSGATLLETLWRSSAVTNDFIDVNNDGTSGSDGSFAIQQLAPLDLSAPFASNAVFGFTYRFTGSGNGIREFDTYNGLFDVCADGSDMAAVTDVMDCAPAADFDAAADIDGNAARSDDGAIYNREDLNNAGVLILPGNGGIAVPGHRGGAPFVSNSTTYQAQLLNPANSGFTVDFASADVPVAWFAIQNGASSPLAAPAGPGYGSNPRVAVNKDGTSAGQSNLLRPLNRLNTDGSVPSQQVFDTPIAIVPVAAIVNYGVGLQEIDQSDLRHAKATGRRVNGENLTIVTRDSGSGTRNAFMNGISLDPSWGIGENVGDRNGNNILGPNFLPSNKSGSGNMDATVRNSRLGIGHTGAERGVNNGLLTGGQMDVLGIRFDVKGGTDFVRPTQAAVIDGGPNGYSVVGPAGIATVGDPRNADAALGGWGWDADGPDNVLGTADDETMANNPFAANPVPANDGVSAFVNNITRSLAAFVADPGGDENDFMPGEFISLNFFPTAAPDSVPANPDPDGMQPIAILGNADQNANVRTAVLNDPGAALNNPVYDAFNENESGLVPAREVGFVYSDGVANGANYINQAGNVVTYGQGLTDRNRIAFDFNGDGVRSAADAADMMAAYDERFGSGTPWAAPAGTGDIAGAPGADAVIEILGDGQGDGNFDDADVRYWADGLVLVNDTLDRMAGFMAVDDAWNTISGGNNNFFGTTFGGTLATAYESGDSVADIAGNLQTPGWAPNGQDGVIDLQDVDYIQANFGDFTDLVDATGADGDIVDLSADMNADLVVDAADALKVIEDIMETEVGDLDLDGDVDADDEAIAMANLGTGTTYSQGDVDFDGDVDNDDLAIIAGACSIADLAVPFGVLDLDDVDAFIAAFTAGDPAADIAPPAGILDLDDVDAFIDAFLAGCP